MSLASPCPNKIAALMHLIVVHRSLEQLHFKIVPLARGEVKEET